MTYEYKNNSSMKINFHEMLDHLMGFIGKKLKIQNHPTIYFDSDAQNAANLLGKTGYYDPESYEVHVYVDGRHPKDIMRSIVHELVHHRQNEKGLLNTGGYHGPGYAQKNPHLRKMELQANDPMLFRDWEDNYKLQQENKMSLKEWKNKELSNVLTNKWGFKMDLSALKENKEITHMCALHVIHEASGKEGHPVAHTLTENGEVSHYTVEFNDVIVENIPVENLQIIQQKEHMHKRDDKKPYDEEKEVVSEDELENPDKADLNDDGELSDYEKKRGAAIEKSMKGE
jgi:hypothetical protein